MNSIIELRKGQGEASGCQQSQGLTLQGEWNQENRFILSYISDKYQLLHVRDRAQPLHCQHQSPGEHSLWQNQKVHNLLSMHQLGSPGQQLRLKRSMMRQNWKNLSFDFQEVQSVSEDPAPLTLQPQEELEDLERYILGCGGGNWGWDHRHNSNLLENRLLVWVHYLLIYPVCCYEFSIKCVVCASLISVQVDTTHPVSQDSLCWS